MAIEEVSGGNYYNDYLSILFLKKQCKPNFSHVKYGEVVSLGENTYYQCIKNGEGSTLVYSIDENGPSCSAFLNGIFLDTDTWIKKLVEKMTESNNIGIKKPYLYIDIPKTIGNVRPRIQR